VLPTAERTQQLAVDDAMVAESCVEERAELLRTAVTVADVVGRLLAVQCKYRLNPPAWARAAGDVIVAVGHSTCTTNDRHRRQSDLRNTVRALTDARYDLLLASASPAHRRACGGGPRLVPSRLRSRSLTCHVWNCATRSTS
jgi:hypothetical protein